jgi:hypothetical protein
VYLGRPTEINQPQNAFMIQPQSSTFIKPTSSVAVSDISDLNMRLSLREVDNVSNIDSF